MTLHRCLPRRRRSNRDRRAVTRAAGTSRAVPRRGVMAAAVIAAAVMAAAVVVAVVLGVYVGLVRERPPPLVRGRPPPRDGYFSLRPVGSFASLPDDATAAARVRRSGWEVRPGNARYNRIVPRGLALQRVDAAARAYDPRWNKFIIGRITGNFTGTTDEIFQWAAAKWGLPDNLIRAIAYKESDWHQSNYGDFVDNLRDCPPGYRSPCPVTFGIVGTRSTSWPGIYPWNRESTAAAVDVLGGSLRGCYEGWAWWLRDHGNRSRGVYHAGDIWGCAGAWYSGDWHDGSAGQPGTSENYIRRVQHLYEIRPWLRGGF